MGVAIGHQTLIVGVPFLSLRSKHDGVMPSSFDHDIEKVRAVGAVDLCTITERGDAANGVIVGQGGVGPEANETVQCPRQVPHSSPGSS
jgi:hypothetical protein